MFSIIPVPITPSKRGSARQQCHPLRRPKSNKAATAEEPRQSESTRPRLPGESLPLHAEGRHEQSLQQGNPSEAKLSQEPQ